MKDRDIHDDTQGGRASKTRLTLHYWEHHHLQPEDLLDFIELPAFTKRWETLGLDVEEDLLALQLGIMAAPKRPKLIKGTTGLRKVRFSPRRWKTGKRGAARVLYVYFEEYGLVLLCLVYGKNEVDDISDAVKRYLNTLIRDVERELKRRYHG